MKSELNLKYLKPIEIDSLSKKISVAEKHGPYTHLVGREFPPDPSKLTARLRAGLAARHQESMMAR